MKFKTSILLLALMAFATGCEDDAKSKLYDAQACLDNIDENVAYPQMRAAAEACEQKLGALTSTDANVIRCSARLIMGGLTTTQFAKAVENLENDNDSSKEAKLIVLLSMKGETKADAKEVAKKMFNACNASGVPGLVYMAGLSLAGTSISSSPLGCAGVCTDQQLQDNATQFVNDCKNDPSQCEPDDIGEAAIAISGAYCVGDKKDEDICVDIQAAIDSAGGVPSSVGSELLNLLTSP